MALVEVTRPPYEQPDPLEQYTDRSPIRWLYYAPTLSVNSAGFLPREEANRLLGYALKYNFHGFGEEHSGLKEVSSDVFHRVQVAYLASAEASEQQHVARAGGGWHGGGGEGPEHKALKNRVSNDPATVLGEAGLKLVKEEWPFRETGDQIDVLLKDGSGRFVAVEVEVDCDAAHRAGALQCMKYRAMLSYFFDRHIEEFRCILVAHSIHTKVQDRCVKHGIEVRKVERLSTQSFAGQR